MTKLVIALFGYRSGCPDEKDDTGSILVIIHTNTFNSIVFYAKFALAFSNRT